MISRRNSTLTLASIALAATFSAASVRAEDAPKVKLATSMGDIVVQLDPAKAPKTVENFLALRQGQALRRHGVPPRH